MVIPHFSWNHLGYILVCFENYVCGEQKGEAVECKVLKRTDNFAYYLCCTFLRNTNSNWRGCDQSEI